MNDNSLDVECKIMESIFSINACRSLLLIDPSASGLGDMLSLLEARKNALIAHRNSPDLRQAGSCQ
jgi:hypothetical protein